MSLEIKKLKKSYPGKMVFNGIDISIKEKKINCLLGVSGIGKTTLLNAICGLTPVDSGDISDFKDKSFSFIFQEPRILNWKTVYGNINFVLKSIYTKKEAEIITKKYISLVGLSEYTNYYPYQISGGMQQRVSIARAFAYPSEILIMDEPFKSLDFKLKTNLMKSFINLWTQDKRTVIFVTHDLDEAVCLGDNIFILDELMPSFIKKEICIILPQNNRLSDHSILSKIKIELADSLNI